MRIVIAGGHGKIALRLEEQAAARGDTTVALIRNPDHEADVRRARAEPAVVDLEDTTVDALAEHLRGADAVVFAAGAGPGSGVERKTTVDRDAALRLADAAARAGVSRYLLISAMRLEEAPSETEDDSVWGHYLRAKKAAEDELHARDLDLTILRPGKLSDDGGTRMVALAPVADRIEKGEIPRDDVAAVVLALLDEPASIGAVLELVGGGTPVPAAVRAVAGGSGATSTG